MAFAPQSIRIRYDDAGALGAAAVGAGAGQAHAQQKAADMQFITSEMNRRQQAAQFAEQNLMEARKLQMAGSLGMQQRAPLQSFQPAPNRGPLASQILARKQATLAAANVGNTISAEHKPIFEAAANDPNVDPSQFERMVDDAVRVTGKAQSAAQSASGKRALFESVRERLTPTESKLFSGMLDQPGVTLDQLRLSMNEAIDQRTVLPRTQLAFQVQGIDAAIRAKRQEMDDISRRMAKEGVSPQTEPAALNPTYTDAEQNVFSSFGFKGGLADALTPYEGNLVEGGKPKARQALIEYTKAQQELKALEQQRSQAMNQTQTLMGGGGGAAPQQQLPKPQTAAEFEAIPKGQMYIDPDDGKQYRKP